MRDNCNGKSKKALKSNEPQNDRNLLQAARDLLNAFSGELKFNCAHQVRWRTRPGLPLGNFGNPDTLNAQFNLSLRQSKLYLCGNLCRLICAKSNIKLLSCRQLSFICRRSWCALHSPPSSFGRAYEGLAAQSRQRIFSLKQETSKMAA